MAIRDHDFTKGIAVSDDVKNDLRPIVGIALGSVALGAELVVDLPEFLAALIVVAIALGAVYTSNLIFEKARNFIGGIWLVGGTLVKGLEAIYKWVYNLFDWIETEIKNGVHDIAQHILNTGKAIFDYYAKPISDRLDNVDGFAHTVYQALLNEMQYSRTIIPALTSVIASNVAAINQRIDGVVNTFNGDITHVANVLDTEIKNRIAAIAALTAALTQETDIRQTDESVISENVQALATKLGQQIAALGQTISTVQTTLQGSIQATESQLQTAVTTIGTLGQEVTTESGEIATQAGEISTLQTTTIAKTATVAELLALPATAIATLIDLANDPCMCLNPIGGTDALLALIAGLEVGVL